MRARCPNCGEKRRRRHRDGPIRLPRRRAKETSSIPKTGGTDSRALPPSQTTKFAHQSERQFARLLDFYQIEWQYEPRSFDIEFNEKGEAIKKFTPDFYLPEFDLFIEITTMNQRLVTKKNRKVRRLRELHPEVKCKIFYQKDYLNLLVKYGLQRPRSHTGGSGNRRLDFSASD